MLLKWTNGGICLLEGRPGLVAFSSLGRHTSRQSSLSAYCKDVSAKPELEVDDAFLQVEVEVHV